VVNAKGNSMKQGSFRHWCTEKWYEHLDEMLSYGQKSDITNSAEYFKKYKFWLKREYKHQEGQSK
jgi:hypothetical protein